MASRVDRHETEKHVERDRNILLCDLSNDKEAFEVFEESSGAIRLHETVLVVAR